MFEKLEIFQTAMTMARHAGQRQAMVAENLANADTPGYRAKELATFQEALSSQTAPGMRTSRSRHLGGQETQALSRVRFSQGEASPNGNTVSIEKEMLNSVEIQRDHNRAIAIYKHSLDLMRMSLGR